MSGKENLVSQPSVNTMIAAYRVAYNNIKARNDRSSSVIPVSTVVTVFNKPHNTDYEIQLSHPGAETADWLERASTQYLQAYECLYSSSATSPLLPCCKLVLELLSLAICLVVCPAQSHAVRAAVCHCVTLAAWYRLAHVILCIELHANLV